MNTYEKEFIMLASRLTGESEDKIKIVELTVYRNGYMNGTIEIAGYKERIHNGTC